MNFVRKTLYSKKMEITLLSNIITTSPCFFNPDTSMISSVIKSLIPMGILKYKTYITCDGYVVRDSHQLKCGVVTKQMTEKYEKFIINLENLIQTDDEIKKYSNNIKILKFNQRFGFAYAIKNAIETEKINSKYIMIIQHDWIFTDPSLQIDDFISKMEKSSDINYIGFVSNSTEKYLPMIKQQYTNDRKRIFNDNNEIFHPQHNTLAKLNFWYDRNHIAKLDYYINFVFTVKNEKDNRPVVRNFFEDTFGHYEMNLFKEKGADAHKLFNNYLYYPILENTNEHSKIVVNHLNGRKFLPAEEKNILFILCKILDEYWKEEFAMPKSFQYTFKKIVLDSINFYEKILNFDKNIIIEDKNLQILFVNIKQIDESFHNSLVDVYTQEKINYFK